MDTLQGTYTALITPFDNGRVDMAALEALIERQLTAGVAGLVPCGTTGEAPTLDLAEHRAIVSLAVKHAGRNVQVIAGSGSNSTQHAIELARINEDCGAHALLVVSPYYNRPPQEGLFRHFSAVAQATRLPIILYNIPGRTGVELAVDTIKRLRENHDNIVAVKDATGDVGKGADVLAVSDIAVLSGEDALTLPLMSVGAVGTISALANLVPNAVQRVVAAALAGDWPEAQTAHRALYRFTRQIFAISTNPIPVKTALAIRGMCNPELRLPLAPLNAEQHARLMALLDEYSELD